MKITVLTRGTQGDIDTFLALSLGLMARGHQVTLCTGIEYEASVRQLNVPFHPIQVRFLEAMRSADGQAARDGDKAAARRQMREFHDPATRQIFRDMWDACQGAEALVCNHMLHYSRHIADKLQIPLVLGTCAPFLLATAAFPFMFLTNRDRGPCLNRLSYLATWGLPWHEYPLVRASCREIFQHDIGSRFLNIFQRRGRPLPTMYYYSPLLLRNPRDWPENAQATGYWHLIRNPDWQPPAELEAWMAAGPTPIYIGFGSMLTRQREQLSRIVIQALEQTGQRAVLCAGEGGIADPERPELVYYTRFVPFEWLFPRVRAVVHHGATGTTSLGLKYGKPTVICPLIGDQEFWGKILYRRGLAPAPFARRYVDLTAERLAAAIRTVVDDPGMRVRAEALAQQLQREDGVSNAVDFVEQQVACWTVTG